MYFCESEASLRSSRQLRLLHRQILSKTEQKERRKKRRKERRKGGRKKKMVGNRDEAMHTMMSDSWAMGCSYGFMGGDHNSWEQGYQSEISTFNHGCELSHKWDPA